MKKILFTTLCFAMAFAMQAQDPETDIIIDTETEEEVSSEEEEAEAINPFYRYRVYLKDKKGSPYSVKRPEEFLSQKAIERRNKQKLVIDETDLPVNRTYLDKVESCGVRLINCSKWNNTVVVQ